MEDITYIKGYNMKLRATKQEKKLLMQGCMTLATLTHYNNHYEQVEIQFGYLVRFHWN